jgi:hypothetical protein
MQSTHNLQTVKSHKCTQITPKTASVVPPEDGRLKLEKCRGFKTLQSGCESENVLSWLRYCDTWWCMVNKMSNLDQTMDYEELERRDFGQPS